MDRDYTHVFFGLVVFAGVIAMLLMVAPGGDQNRIGAATELPTEANDVQEFPLSRDDSVMVAGKEIRLSPNGISINGEGTDFVLGEVYVLDSRRNFMVENGILYVFDKWESQTCEGITGQTRATSPGSVCCDGQSTPLPDCSTRGEPIQCGEKTIYCENGQLKSRLAQTSCPDFSCYAGTPVDTGETDDAGCPIYTCPDGTSGGDR